MELIEFYRNQLLQSLAEFEAEWKEVTPYSLGFKWERQLSNFREIFRITKDSEDFPQLIYSVVLPEAYKQRNITELLEPFSSKYEISLTYFHKGLILTVSTHTETLTETVLGFLYRARGELVELIEISVNRTV